MSVARAIATVCVLAATGALSDVERLDLTAFLETLTGDDEGPRPSR